MLIRADLGMETALRVTDALASGRFGRDVSDAEVRTIFASVKQQCGIRNVIIDRDVTGRGTFLFRDVPCEQAIRTITASLGLGVETEPAYLRVASQR